MHTLGLPKGGPFVLLMGGAKIYSLVMLSIVMHEIQSRTKIWSGVIFHCEKTPFEM